MSQPRPATTNIEQINARAREIFSEHQLGIWKTTDRLFAYLLVFEWLGAIVEALVLSPKAWSGSVSQTHLHVFAASFLGAAIIAFPVSLAVFQPGRTLTRHCIALSQMVMSALLIHLSGGRIETHFHVFASLAFLGFYRDWKVFVTASTVVALDHFLRGIFWPQSVYGTSVIEPFRWLEHTAWVIFEDIFLIMLSRQGINEMRKSAWREATNAVVEKMRDEAIEATNLKSQFVANISHELRTPLVGVLGMNELLLSTDLTPQQRELAETVQSSAKALSVLLNDILDLSKIEANKIVIECIEFNPIAMLHDCTQLLMPAAGKKKLLLNCDIEPRIPSCLKGDPTRLHQIVVNLLGNAIKFTEQGTITVRAHIEHEDEKSVVVKFAVSDTGIGLSESEKQNLFSPFTQADGSTTRRYGGSGLGLAICKRLAMLMGGDVGVVSAKGQGSTFWFTVPLERIALAPSPPPETAAELAHSAITDGGWILVVEDNPVLQRLEMKQLESLGFKVRAVASGQAALEELPRLDYMLVLMDCHLPDLDGYEATRRIRLQEKETGKHIPILAVTAAATSSDRDKCLAAGMDEYLSKPYTMADLRERVQSLLKTQHQRA